MRWLLWLIAAPVLCLSLDVAFGAETKPADDPPRLSARGQVVDPDGRPVAGARVVLREWPTIRRSDDPYRRDVRDILAETKSDADGRFEFVNVVSRPFKGYRDRTPWDVVALADGFAAAWAHLAKPTDERDLMLKLSEAKKIAGRLVDESGKPIAECKVQVATVDAPRSRWHTDLGDSARLDLWSCELTPRATTDKDGQFEIAGVQAEKRLTLIAEHPDFARGHFYAATTAGPQAPVEQTSVSPDGKREESQQLVHMTGFTETLKRGGSVRGRVVLADIGKPVPAAKINAILQNRAHYAIADEGGRFEFTSLSDPTLIVTASSLTDAPRYLAARETVSFSEGKWTHVVELRLPRGKKVNGRVVDEETGAGVAKVQVSYILDRPDEEPWSPTKSQTTDAAGRFEIVVPAGPGELRVYTVIDRHPTHDVPDHWRWQSKKGISPHHSAKIDVVAGRATDEVVLKVGRGLVIRGTVVDERGKPVFAAVVHTIDRYGRNEDQKQTVTDDSGRFELAGFPPHEEQRLEVNDLTTRHVGDAAVHADEKAVATRVVELPPITLRGTGRVLGKVLGDGKPLAGVTVWLQRESEPPNVGDVDFRPSQSWWMRAQEATTDSDGQYEFEAVDAGKQFMISVSTNGYTDANSRMQLLKVGETVELPALELKSRSAFVAGIVVDPDGKPVAGVTVSASERNGGGISRRGPAPKTGPDGRFRLEDLPSVPLELMAYIRTSEPTKDRSIRFPAHVNAEPNQTDLRIVLDPKLQRPLP